jgi:hypothetical protein
MRRSALVLGPAIGLLVLGSCVTEPQFIGGQSNAPVELASSPAVVEARGFLVSARSDVTGDDSNALRVVLSVDLVNTLAIPASLEGICVVQVRASPTAAPGTTWRSPRLPRTSCPSPLGTRQVDSGRYSTLVPQDELAWPRVDDILGDSLDVGSYRFSVLLRIGGDTVSVPAGTVPLMVRNGEPDDDPRRLNGVTHATVEGVSPREVVIQVVGTNLTPRPAEPFFGACAITLRVYASADRSGAPVWTHQPGACVSIGYSPFVAQGERLVHPAFGIRLSIPGLLGDSLPAGRYYFTAELAFLRLRGDRYTDDRITLLAGSADLDATIEPMPSEREIGGVRYRAETATETDGALRVTLSATNVTSDPTMVRSAFNPCDGQIFGYDTAERRDRWHMMRRPDWVARGCVLTIPTTRIAPGRTHVFVGVIPPPVADTARARSLALNLMVDRGQPSADRFMLAAGQLTSGR